jgi:GST-like protein
MRKGAADPLGSLLNLKQPFEAIDSRPAVARAREVGKDHPSKRVNNEEANHCFGG